MKVELTTIDGEEPVYSNVEKIEQDEQHIRVIRTNRYGSEQVEKLDKKKIVKLVSYV